ncbi:recombinase family protein [Actinomyces oris]|uniref:Recombinase family protein n=1 Tax=Actinomyces oris TaxID=544580 RepID=A0AAW9KH99_9ACTO|nr:recombinase family protein [Actinomyces oris]MEA1304465.1 recombinase family protein [Actinomyces oris]
MTTQTRTNTPDKPHEPAAVLEEVPATALDGQAGTGPIAIFYGAARYPFELARQRELIEDYADAMGLNLVTEFHDRQQRQHGLSMLLDACQRGGVEYVITAGWPTPNLTTTEADVVTDQLAQACTHLVCLNSWHPGDGEPPAWWNDEEGAWMRQLDALREHERRQREQTSEHSQPGESGEIDQVGDSGQPSDGNQTGEVSDGTDARETSKAGDASKANEQYEEVHHA